MLQTVIIPGTFPRPARCQGQLYTYGTGPDEVTQCPECGAVWSMDKFDKVTVHSLDSVTP